MLMCDIMYIVLWELCEFVGTLSYSHGQPTPLGLLTLLWCSVVRSKHVKVNFFLLS